MLDLVCYGFRGMELLGGVVMFALPFARMERMVEPLLDSDCSGGHGLARI